MILRNKERLKARRLRCEGRSIKQIAQELGFAKSSVSVWVRDVKLTNSQKKFLADREIQGGIKGRQILIKKWQEYRKYHLKPKGPRWPLRKVEFFFDTWTPNMAYILGYFTADGCMYKNKQGSGYISFTSADFELIQLTKTLMEVSNTIEIYQPKKGRCKLRYTIQIGSKKIFNRLLELGMTPNKSLTLQCPSVPEPLFCHFLRGNFDGDGCAYSRYLKRKGRKKKYLYLQASFTCGNRKFLEIVQNKLCKLANMGYGSLRKHTSVFTLSYSANDVAKLYNFLYPSKTLPYLKRKKVVIEEGLKAWGRSAVG